MAKLGRRDFTFLGVCIFVILFTLALIITSVKSNAQQGVQLVQVAQVGNTNVWKIIDGSNTVYLAERPGNIAITK